MISSCFAGLREKLQLKRKRPAKFIATTTGRYVFFSTSVSLSIRVIWSGHLAESLFKTFGRDEPQEPADPEPYQTLTADQLTHAESRGGGGGGGCGGRLVEGALPVGHVEQAGLRGRWPGLTLLRDTRTRRIRHTTDGIQHQSLLNTINIVTHNHVSLLIRPFH